ncbi:MAG TPA: glycosyltransferase family 2 protein [Candidatus Baltobacteraceae bacterium]|nr:glycosyltransferase family 2 protein [Candidatus Baltobacteraceae bacterium]
MRLSVVIATKDRAAYLERALESLGKQIGAPSFEVVVVDNGSTDATREVAQRAGREQPYPVSYVYEAQPNRGAARNRGIAAAHGHLILFCDDDVYAPPGFLASHDAAHTLSNFVVSGPIINVPGYAVRPKPTLANYSRAFFCTCNVSVPKVSLEAVGGFDEAFHLYGWEDTELGVRLREHGMRAKFAWDAYIWHVKPPRDVTLDSQLRKAVEKARMAVRFLEKNGSARVRSATGAHRANLLRAKALEPMLPWFAGAATDDSLPAAVRGLARAQLLDAMYTVELARALGGAGSDGVHR